MYNIRITQKSTGQSDFFGHINGNKLSVYEYESKEQASIVAKQLRANGLIAHIVAAE